MAITLYDYQEKCISWINDYLKSQAGYPCLKLTTGAGKSVIIAELCKQLLQNEPDLVILNLTHVKKIVQQNYKAMRAAWANAPICLYGASLKKKQLSEPIIFGMMQSLRKKSELIGHVDYILIDEAHLVCAQDVGGYRTLINNLTNINPRLRVIGFTATPYRMDHGLITDKPAIFDEIYCPITTLELMQRGRLAWLRSKSTAVKLSAKGVKKRGGDYLQADLQTALNTSDQNLAVCQEVIEKAGDRKHWLFFCAGIAHADRVAECLQSLGISAKSVTSKMAEADRDQVLSDFEAGHITALTNVDILTTGFNFPAIDLIVFMRPTLSAGLYEQMAGRGTRLKPHTDHCLVLDFAGLVETHGPITNIITPTKVKKGETKGEAPVKICSECDELIHISAKSCTNCGYIFPPPTPKTMELRQDDILGIEGTKMQVENWSWKKHISKTSGKEMLKVEYQKSIFSPPLCEYFFVLHDGFAGHKSRSTIKEIVTAAGVVDVSNPKNLETIDDFVGYLSKLPPPAEIEYLRDGKYHKILQRVWL